MESIRKLKDMYLGELSDDDPLKQLFITLERNRIDNRDQEEKLLEELEKLIRENLDLKFNNGERVEDKVLEISSDDDS